MEIKEKVVKYVLPVMDTMEILSGRWKIVIISTLCAGGKMRFNELKANIPKITGRALSKDLKLLEAYEIVSRTIKDTSPITVEYELTNYGSTLGPVIDQLNEWGLQHREKIVGLKSTKIKIV